MRIPQPEERVIARRRVYQRRQSQDAEHRVNGRIRFPQIRVIDPEGEQLGVMSPQEGRDAARERGLDLVEVAPNARPPVCRIMDYGKFRYEQSKRRTSSKSQKTTLKTFRLRPNTSDHDLETKLRKALESLERGDKVKFEMRMRGRERAVTGRWVERMHEIIGDVCGRHEGDLNLIQRPRAEGQRIIAMLEPSAA